MRWSDLRRAMKCGYDFPNEGDDGDVCDFVIADDCRGQKLGTWMLEVLIAHPHLARTNQLLITRDAMSFYGPHGFAQHPYVCMKRPAAT